MTTPGQPEPAEVAAPQPACNGMCLTASDIGVPEADYSSQAAAVIAISHPACDAHGVFSDPARAPGRLAEHLDLILVNLQNNRRQPTSALDREWNAALDKAISTVEEFIEQLGLPPSRRRREESHLGS
jgi:hypothetical protein